MNVLGSVLLACADCLEYCKYTYTDNTANTCAGAVFVVNGILKQLNKELDLILKLEYDE